MQEKLFRLEAGSCTAQGFGADGAPLDAFGGKALGSAAAVCPVGNRVYLSISGEPALRWLRV